MDAGTSFNADLRRPLDFGTEPLTPALVEHIGTPPPSGSVVHAVLVTPLGSANSKKDDPVEAVITRPLVASDRLILPEGSRLKGSVLQVRHCAQARPKWSAPHCVSPGGAGQRD